MNPIPFKIFGLQRSGTNLAQLLMLQNFEVASLEKQNEWKHGPISEKHRDWVKDGQPVRLIICVKNPYAWLVSCYNYFRLNKHFDRTIDRCFQKTWTFGQFVHKPSYNFQNPIDRWNKMIRHWLDFPVHKKYSEIILHESMLDPQGQQANLLRIEVNQGLVRKGTVIADMARKVDCDMRLRGDFNFEVYQQKQYMVHYPDKLLSFVNEAVDMDLFRRFGYKVPSHAVAMSINPNSLVRRCI
jgi:hypothetical protein